MTMITKVYINAFDDEMEQQHFNEEQPIYDEEKQHHDEEKQPILAEPEHWDEESLSDDGYEAYNSDYEPDYYDDADDEEAELAAEEDKILEHSVYMKIVNEKYAKALEECGEVLEGKLNWVDFENEPTSDLDEEEYPTLPGKMEKPRERYSTCQNFKKSPIKINVISFGPSRLNFRKLVVKIDRVCKYILQGEVCPFGDECRFTHTLKKPLCKFGPDCKNKKCTAFHPRKSSDKTKKIWFCKNVITRGECRFGDKCVFAHTVEEVQKHVEPCKFGNNCRAVKRVNGKYTNFGPRKCVRLHPKEQVKDFVARTQ